MLRYGGVVIPMQINLDKNILDKMQYLIGDNEMIMNLSTIPVKEPFSDAVCEFLNDVSKTLMNDYRSRAYSDVMTFGFWLRNASTTRLKVQYAFHDENIHIGRGNIFHIAPSNVPVNFAFSLAAGLLLGNSNIVRVPSKNFEQITIIKDAFIKTLETHVDMKPYIILVRYEHDKGINDALSSIADTRIIWGGDTTIAEIRKSTLPPRSNEITFADRYSIAVIDSDRYMEADNKTNIALDFYNDTYFTDQNACTSPRIVVWTGKQSEEAKKLFWYELHKLVRRKYIYQPIMGINKLTSSYLTAINEPGVKIESHTDNLIIRVSIPRITSNLIDLMDNCGFFLEYTCEDIMEIEPLCDDRGCQTVGLYGNGDILLPLLNAGIKGIDRVVPIGKSMDFELIWDGYNLPAIMTRTIVYDSNVFRA